MLQQDRQIATIRKGLVKKVLDRLAEMADKEPEPTSTFWGQFGRAVKEGVSEDYENRDKLLPLLRFASSHDEEKLTTPRRLPRADEGGPAGDLLPDRREP
jgi:molecular chaperone HtpG